MWSRRAVLAGLAAGMAGAALADTAGPGIGPDRSLLPRRRGDGGTLASQPPDPGQLITAADLGGQISYALADAATGALIETHDPDTALPPASVMKALTAAWAMDRLGPAFRFQTRVLASGPVAGGRVQGDLILAGGGDPVLDTDMLGDMVARLAGQGLRGATGQLLLWEGALPRLRGIDPDQPVFVGYNPAISGLNLNFNRVHFEWRRAGKAPAGWQLSMDARARRYTPAVSRSRVEVARRETPLFTYEERDGREAWTVASAALGQGGARWLPVFHPALYAGEVFRTLGAAQGLVLPEPALMPAAPEGQELARHDSDALPVILSDMLRFSTNLTAEVMGLSASGAATHQASAQAMADWARARHGMQAVIADHSGLGGGSRITSADMARMLVAQQGGALPGLLRDHGIYDAGGKRQPGHPVQVRAKTGTLNFVSGLAGYITQPGGRRLAFAIFAADTARRDRLSLAEREAPPGGQAWSRRARNLQNQLIRRWSTLYA